jgi:acyl-CoA hydrolase
VQAHVTFVATHSLEVLIEVKALNPLTGVVRKTNTARAWYVAKSLAAGAPTQPALLPQMVYPSAEVEAAGHARYEKQKQLRQSARDVSAVVEACSNVRQDMMRLHLAGDNRVQGTVSASASSLVQLMLPSDCGASNVVQAGAIMKLMVRAFS